MPAAFPADSITNVARWRRGPEKLAATAISVKHMAASGPTGWKAVHWRRLNAEAHLGYRKGKQGGVWFVRWRNHHEGGNYKQVPVGVANDINDKPAAGILTYEQAVRTAREAVARARTEAASQAAGPAPT